MKRKDNASYTQRSAYCYIDIYIYPWIMKVVRTAAHSSTRCAHKDMDCMWLLQLLRQSLQRDTRLTHGALASPPLSTFHRGTTSFSFCRRRKDDCVTPMRSFSPGGGISRASAGSADLVTATPPDTDSNLVGRTEQMMMTGTRCDLCEWEVSAHPHGVQSRPAGCYTCWPINNTQAFFLFKDV